ncbi:MAG: efflux RND transporter periplasmic adaptor subunit [Lachnospiraceae bacterium]|nr:efflux RND transporter periplasmic adaptor subunit [Lachnospiraceae bacterium]
MDNQVQNNTVENENAKNSLANGKEMSKNAKGSGGKIVYYVLIIIVILAAAYMLFKRLTFKKEVDFNAIPSVNVTHIRKGSISKEVSVIGNILPTDTYYVVAKVGGDIKNINVKNGDYVKKGDPICEIDASKEIEAAFIQYDTAKSSYERMQKLYQAGDISLQNFETVKAQYEAAKLAYDTKVEYSVPVAVDDGVIENTNMTINTSINQGTVLCYITSEGAKEVNFGVTERVLEGLKLNDPVKIEKTGKVYDGYVSNISNLINAQTGLFDVKAVITSENAFASGIMAKVTFPYITKRNINVLPNELIYYEASNPYVFVVNNEGLVNKKYIEVGIEDNNYTEVITNIDKNTKIVSTWNNDLAEGATVNVVKDEKVEDEIYIETTERKKRNYVIASESIASNSDIVTEVE